jgi:hypothetical protein
LVNISRGIEKGSHPTEFVFGVKNENYSKRDVSNLKASFKKRADKIFHLDNQEIVSHGMPRQNDGFFLRVESTLWRVDSTRMLVQNL